MGRVGAHNTAQSKQYLFRCTRIRWTDGSAISCVHNGTSSQKEPSGSYFFYSGENISDPGRMASRRVLLMYFFHRTKCAAKGALLGTFAFTGVALSLFGCLFSWTSNQFGHLCRNSYFERHTIVFKGDTTFCRDMASIMPHWPGNVDHTRTFIQASAIGNTDPKISNQFHPQKIWSQNSKKISHPFWDFAFIHFFPRPVALPGPKLVQQTLVPTLAPAPGPAERLLFTEKSTEIEAFCSTRGDSG